MKKKQFKAESKRLLDLMINSIYTNKEIFDSLKSYRDLNDLKTSEELDESEDINNYYGENIMKQIVKQN